MTDNSQALQWTAPSKVSFLKRPSSSKYGQLALLCGSLYIAPVTLSQEGALTPGGVEPQIERRELPQVETSPEISIPAVPDRPLDIGDGPKVMVKRFKIAGIEDLPKGNVSQLLAAQLSSHPDGFTIGELQAAADQITQYYRQQGYILTQAFIPQQDVIDGSIILQVLSGRLGQLSTANNKHYSDNTLSHPLQEMIGKTIEASAIESALLRINDLPGIDASGVFRAGKNVGETELIINVNQETPYEAILIADNHGADTTGKQRAIGQFRWNNPTGAGDELRLTALQTFDPTESFYWGVNYERVLGTPALTGGIAYSTNDYFVSEGLDLSGETQTSTLYTRYSFVRSRDINLYGRMDFSHKRAKAKVKDLPTSALGGEDKLSVMGLELGFDHLDKTYRGFNEGSIRYSHGLGDFAGAMDKNDPNALRKFGAGTTANNFSKLALNFSRLQSVTRNHNLLLRIEGQHSDDLLSSIEQYSLGGPNSVRAYPVSEYIRDKALFSSVEWVANAPGFSDKEAFSGRTWGEVFRISLFADYALGKSNEDINNKKVEISGAGIGLELSLPNAFFIRLEAAKPLGSLDADNGDNAQYWLSAGLQL